MRICFVDIIIYSCIDCKITFCTNVYISLQTRPALTSCGKHLYFYVYQVGFTTMEHRLPSSIYDDGIIDRLSLVARSSVVIDRALNLSRQLTVPATKRRRLNHLFRNRWINPRYYGDFGIITRHLKFVTCIVK